MCIRDRYYTVPVSQSPQNPPAPAQLSRSTMWWGTMIFVASSSGFSTWLIIWAAASIPSWQAFTSTDVRGGKVGIEAAAQMISQDVYKRQHEGHDHPDKSACEFL